MVFNIASILLFLTLISIVSSRTDTPEFLSPPVSQGCVDPNEFKTCLEEGVNKYHVCISEVRDGVKGVLELNCELAKRSAPLLCYMQSCWNKIYSCDYQIAAVNVISLGGFEPEIPYFPAPDNAPGGCACNIGHIFRNMTMYAEIFDVNCKRENAANSESLKACQCCAQSGFVASWYSICPNTDLSIFSMDLIVSSHLGLTPIAAHCNITTDGCLRRGYVLPPGGKFVPINVLPSNKSMTEPFTSTGVHLMTLVGAPTKTVTLHATTAVITCATRPAWDDVDETPQTSNSSSSSSSAALTEPTGNMTGGPDKLAGGVQTADAQKLEEPATGSMMGIWMWLLIVFEGFLIMMDV